MDASGAGTRMQEEMAGRRRKRKRMRAMVAVDESDGSFYALQWALDYLFDGGGPGGGGGGGVAPTDVPGEEEEDDGVIFLVHVQPPFHQNIYPAGPGGAVFYSTPSLVESVRKAQAENSAALLSSAMQKCTDKMVKAEALALEGDPKDGICQASEQMNVDLLVVGSRGLGKIKRTFLGSVSDYCAHHAKCPVLIVKPPRETAK